MNLLSQRATGLDTAMERALQCNAPTKASRLWWDVGAVALLLGIVVAVFYRTVLFGLPISRIGLIAEWDSLFNSLRRGGELHIDPSAVLLALPTYSTIAAQYHAGQLPLWNSLNAFGAPLVGDVQATVFSPLRILFDSMPCMFTYNLELVAQVVVAAVGTYLLCRTIGCARVAAIGAALSYALCPFVLWYLELQSGVGFALNPVVFWGFARCAKLGTVRSALVAGLICGATILMGHPETSFFAIVFGALLLFGLRLRSAKLLALAGVAAFCTCAPTFLPFIEFARNSDCYKYVVGESAYMPWQALVVNLFTPIAGGASPYVGMLCVPFAVGAWFGARRREAVVFGCLCAMTVVLAAKLWPLSLISRTAPFNYLITVYAVPLVLLCVCVLFALGLTALCEDLEAKAGRTLWWTWGLVAALLIGAGVVPLALQAGHFGLAAANFDMTLGGCAFNKAAVVRGAVVCAIAGVVVGLSGWCGRTGRSARTVIGAAIVALNMVAVLPVVKMALPAQGKFELPRLACLEFLRRSGERCVAVGTHLAKPDVNLLYGIDDVRSINAMLPPRYVRFVKACGASADQFTQWFDGDLKPLLDLGSVRYVLAQTAVVGTDDDHGGVSVPTVQVPGVGSVRGVVRTDSANRHLVGCLDWTFEDNTRQPPLTASLCLVDADGKVVWFSDRANLVPTQPLRMPLPVVQTGQQYSLQMQLFDAKTGADVNGLIPITPDVGALHCSVPSSAHYKLLRQFDGGVRIYENTQALPRAYLVDQWMSARNGEQALQLIQSPRFDRHNSAVVEGIPSQGSPGHHSVKLVRRAAGEVKVVTESTNAGLLVVTDTFYPGWKAYVDGRQMPIVRANYLFRGVLLPAGKHEVVMRYYPETFAFGVLCFLGFWLMALYALGRKVI